MLDTSDTLHTRVPIAVIGIGCWYPGARTPLQLWENILARRLEFRRIPDSRLPLADYCDPAGEAIDKSYAQRVAVLDGFEFDWAGRRIPKSMYESTDLVHWLSLEVAEKALTDAGYTAECLDRDGTGVVVGNTLTGDITRAACMRGRWPYVRRTLRETCEAHGLSSYVVDTLENSMETLYKSAFAEPTADTLAGGLANTIAGRVCNYFDLHGGGYIVDGACSSSLLAVCTAGRALSAGDMDMALVGGIDISIDPFELVGFSRAGALSKGDMHVYDRAAAGFIAGEGCGFVVLKRLQDAKRDGNRIYAVMRGWGISSDGKGGIMTPSSKGQATAIRRAYVGTGYSPADLDFVEGHGTGTRVGDQVELEGISLAQTNGQQPADRRTGMTSLKSIIGHTKAAAGIGAFIKATMAVNRRILPPTGSCVDPNPVFKDKCRSLYPLMHGRVADPGSVVRAGVSAMGFGGINSHVTLESGDAPCAGLNSGISESAIMASNQTSEVFVFHAASYGLLDAEVAELLEVAPLLSPSDLVDLSAQLCGQVHEESPIRAVVVAGSVEQLVQGLQTLRELAVSYPPEIGEVKSSSDRMVWLSNQCSRARVGFLFPGQGAQQLLMTRKIVERFDWAREMVAAADRVQRQSNLPTFTDTVLVNLQQAIDRDHLTALRKNLAMTEVAQIAIVTASMICSRYLEELGIRPTVCAGHSLGELTALHQAGAFDFESLLRLVSLRGTAMAGADGQTGAMAALFCSRQDAESLISDVSGYVVIANVNSTKQVVISGDPDAIQEVIVNAVDREISTARLNVSNAFHSRYVNGASEILRQKAAVPTHPECLNIDVHSCVDGQKLQADLDLRDHLSRQVVEMVDFVSMVSAIESECDLLIEVGPNNVLTRLCDEILTWSSTSCLPMAAAPDVECDINKVLAKAFTCGVRVRWHRLFENRLVREFVPVNDRKFIGNPCENPHSELGPVTQLALAPVDVAGVSALPLSAPSPIAPHVSRDSVNMEQVETPAHVSTAVDEQRRGTSATTPGPISNHPVPRPTGVVAPRQLPQSGTAMHQTESPQPMNVSASNDRFEEIVIDIIQERTGFPKDSLTPELRLLDDLNLDSIKAGDIIATAARRLGALGPIDPASLADASIADVVAVIREAAGEEAPVAATVPVEASVAKATAEPINPNSDLGIPSFHSEPNTATAATVRTAAPLLSTEVDRMTADVELSEAESNDEIESLIIDIIHERTGFPKDTLTKDLRLLDDLNLDSIKAGDIIATVARKLGALGPIDPASLADATIEDVARVVRQAQNGDTTDHASQTQAAAPSARIPGENPPSPQTPIDQPAAHSGLVAAKPKALHQQPADLRPSVEPPAQMKAAAKEPAVMEHKISDWVRNFSLELVPHRPASRQEDIGGRHYRILHEPNQKPFVELIAKQLHERGATSSFEMYHQPGVVTGNTGVEGRPFYVIAVLPKQTAESSAHERLHRMVHRLRRAVAHTSMIAPSRAAGVAFVQFGNGKFGMEGHSNIERCTAAAFARALHLESPGLQVRIMDFADELSHFLASDFITNEMAAEETFRDAAYDRLGRRFETRHLLNQPSCNPPKPLEMTANDVVLVTGGARGITAECALALAQKTGANFALVGSSPHPADSSGVAADEINATLRRFDSMPGKCEYFSCDLTDIEAVGRLIAAVEQKLGRVTGVVHGAGRNRAGMASGPTHEEVLVEISPKVLGAMNLLETLANRPLRCFVGLTSIIGVTGIPGNSWYAFSNETLDLLLRQYQAKHPETLVRSVSYSAWKEVGMGAKGQVETNLRRMGVGMIPPDEGVQRFMHALEHELDDPQMIVTACLGGIDTWRPRHRDKCTQRTRFVDQVISHEPAISLTTRVRLNHQRDPYLADHIYEGTCLFPAVLGMEAMAQAAAYLMPERPTLIRIQNVELTRPIIVGEEGEVELEIHAAAAETNGFGETVVSVGIRTERTQFQFDHFAAEIVFGKAQVGHRQPDALGQPLQLDARKDLYGGILFQGPKFQRWGTTYHLEEGKVVFEVGHRDATVQGVDVFEMDGGSDPLISGDPYYRDVLLQSVQAVIPRKIGLPLSIERIEFFAPPHDESSRDENRLVTSMLHVIADEVGKEHVCEVIAKDRNGYVRERITGYRVKVLAIKDEYPTADQLADLPSFEQATLDRQVATAFTGLQAKSPVMRIRRMPELHGMQRGDRRTAELPLINECIAAHSSLEGQQSRQPAIEWLDSGKPVVDDASCEISLSHDEEYCLGIAASDLAGCDIAPITGRSREQWSALVGMHNAPLLDALMTHGDSLDEAGTRIWAAVEAAQKSIDEATPICLQIGRVEGHNIELGSDQLAENSLLMTMPISLHRGPQRIIAVVVPRDTNRNQPTVVANGTSLGSRLLKPARPMSLTKEETPPVTENWSPDSMPAATQGTSEPKIRTDVAGPGECRAIENVKAEIKWDGPRDQAVFEHRFVVTFKECAMRGKHVQHTQFLDWMGGMRENGLLYLVPDMVIKLSDGLSGMATNWTEIDVVGEAMMGDVIVARLWMESKTDASICLCCDFLKALPGGRYERLATVQQGTTWVRLDGRNDPVKEPFPKFLADAFESMAPRNVAEKALPEYPTNLGRLKLEVKKLHAQLTQQPVTVWAENFSTCMDDSNIVGNIYYSRYFHWQWRTSDLFLYSAAPQLMAAITALSDVRELIPLNSRIDFIRDAFPFDRIQTELAVTRFTESSATFQFTHYRLNDNDGREKLSVGTQDVVWVRRTPSGTAVPEPFPLAVREAIRRRHAASAG